MSKHETAIKQTLEEFWDERVIPSDDTAIGTVDDLIGPMESMTAVDVLLSLDKILGAKLPNSVIKAGGYGTKEEFIDELTASVLTHLSATS